VLLSVLIASLLDESPSTLMALPPTVTGTETDTGRLAPPATLSSPVVVLPLVDDGAAAAIFDASAPLVDESPSTLTAVPPMFTGTETDTGALAPPAMLSSPDVDGVLAAGVAAAESVAA
jgi:hypothetical protein